MGRVLRAYDESLHREVALKLLQSDDPDAVERFLREARAQARVDHPNVAKVHEVGYRDGRPCIIMQLVDGEPLDRALSDRPLEEKVRVLRQVAEAVHAAHEVGLIHRDLKPTNILIEEGDGGRLVPYVLDFGIARIHEDSDLTVTGQALGTPGYMSPEQARGDLRNLDRRSDVFSLGILLYEVLTGIRPFDANSQLAALVKVLQEDPPPLSRTAPTLPVDLRAIVERCLEKDPNRRYDSARALAEDLGRWLRGEPVSARPVGTAGRLWRKSRRHPLATSLVGGALLLAVGLGAWAWITQSRAARRTTFARALGRQIERLESSLRLAHLAPAHDIREAEHRVETEIEEIEARGRELPETLRGPTLYARGRGWMVLGRWKEAEAVLERAADLMPEDPTVSLALGRTLAERFREEIEQARRLESLELQEAAIEEARRRYARRAAHLLEKARSEVEDLRPHESEMITGLLALLEDDLETAVSSGLRAVAVEEWFYEGEMLQATARLRQASLDLFRGHSERAGESLAEARKASARAVEIGRSNPATYTLDCRAWLRTMEVRSARAKEPDTGYERARESCRKALRVHPEYLPAYSLLAEAGWRMAAARARRGDDPRPTLRTAIESARRGLDVREDPRLLTHLGNLYWVWGNWRGDHGESPDGRYRKALDAMERATELEPGDPYLLSSLGNTWKQYGFFASHRGDDPTPAWQEAREAYLRGLENPGLLERRLANGLCNLGSHWGYHVYLRGEDPTSFYDWMMDACRRALRLDPDDRDARQNLAVALWSRALWAAEVGEEPGPLFAEAKKLLRSILEEDPDRLTTKLNLTSLLLDQARNRLDTGRSAEEILATSDRHLEALARAYPREAPVLKTRILLLRARQAAQAGEDSRELFEEAVRQAERSRSDVFSTYAAEFLARALRHRAAHLAQIGEKDRARKTALEGLRTVEEILTREETLVPAWIARGAMERLLAKLTEDPEERTRWRAAATASLERVREMKPHLELENVL